MATDYLAIASELQRKIDEHPEARLRIIQETYAELVKAGDFEGANYVLLLRMMIMSDPSNQPPKWLQPAGLLFGLVTLLFFMAIVVAGIFGHPVPDASKFPVLIVFALGSALSASFLTGHASMSGQIPFGDKNPVAVSAGGGIAVLFIILILGYTIYLR
jgi:hypothetical protein